MATSMRARAPTATALDHYTRLVGRVLDVPVACISLIDVDGWLTTSSFGLAPPNAMLIAWSFLKRTKPTGHPLVIDDARADPRVMRMPVVQDGTVAAFLGMRLVASDGCAVGTLSATDESPRRWTSRDLEFMRGVRGRILAMRGGTPATRGISAGPGRGPRHGTGGTGCSPSRQGGRDPSGHARWRPHERGPAGL